VARVITVARKPCSEGSVAANSLKWGTGGINVDGSRLFCGTSHFKPEFIRKRGGMAPSDERQGAALGMFAPGTVCQPTNHAGGRWPANLILVHKPGCKRVGEKKVVGAAPQGQGFDWNKRIPQTSYGMQEHPVFRGYSGPDGTETIDAWECEPGCPVAELDQQSGESPVKSPLLPSPRLLKKETVVCYGRGLGTSLVSHGDAGGASRFFKQVGGDRSCE